MGRGRQAVGRGRQAVGRWRQAVGGGRQAVGGGWQAVGGGAGPGALGVLVDTSAWIDALRIDGDPEVRAAVREVTAEGAAVLCDMVRLELWIGAQGDAEQRMIRDLEKELETVATPPEVWDTAVKMARAGRRIGITVPATDLLVAACADHHGLDLLHNDAHFDQISRAVRDSVS